MSNITPSKTIDINEELKNLALYRYHPNGIFNAAVNRIKDITDGRIELVDPSNPLVYLIETSSINTAYAIQEYVMLTRKRYPRLANNEDDLYLHMSDDDFIGRFSEPSYAHVEYNILLNDFKTKAYHDPVLNEHVFKIPRNFKLTVDKYVYTLPAGIIIRMTDNDVIDVKFENQDYGSVFPVTTNYIDFMIKNYNHEETYIQFKVRTPEVDLEMVDIPVEKSKLFKGNLTYNPGREFYYFTAHHFLNGQWVPMIVTHTDQVYDINTPTCIVKVNQTDKSVDYYVPPVFVNSGRLGTRVKFVIYTTCGPINVNFSDNKLEDFSTEYNPVFPEIELDNTTDALRVIAKAVYIKDEVVGGKGPMSFDDLKAKVISNSIGDRKLPITMKQLEHSAEQVNFRIIKDVDIITGRTLLLETDVPRSPSRYPITKMNMDLMEYVSTTGDMTDGKNSVFGINQDITIIPEGTVFKVDAQGLQLVDHYEWMQLKQLSGISLTDKINSSRYLSTFYHYVLDTSNDRTVLRAYDINAPKIEETNFLSFNSTTRVGINTTGNNLYKTENGYVLDILANIKRYSESINENNITPYLVYQDRNGGMFYLEGRLFTSIEDQPVYRFDILSDYYINANNDIVINNFMDTNGAYVRLDIPLDSKIDLIYVSNLIPNSFVASDNDRYIHGSFLAIDKAVVTLERLSLVFGYWLEHLNTQIHTSVGNEDKPRYEEDVPLLYTETVYDANNNVVHLPGDPVLDEENNPVIKHHKGDLVLDDQGNTIAVPRSDLLRYMKLLFVDYKTTVVTDELILNYRKYLRSYLTEVIVENAKQLQTELLENTKAYVVVPKSLDNIQVKTRGRVTYIRSGQSFEVVVHVTPRIYEDTDARQGIETTILNNIEDYLYNNQELSKTVLLNTLYTNLKEFIKGISIERFTELNEEFIEITNDNARIGINKLLTFEPGGYGLVEDVTITFVRTN